MPHHIVAWFANPAQAVLFDTPPVQDGIMGNANGHLVPDRDYHMWGAAAMSANLQRAQFTSGTLRQVNPTYIRPIIGAATPGNNPNFMDLMANPPRVQGLEELTLNTFHGGAAAEHVTALAILGKEFIPVPAGDTYYVRWTSVTAVVANTWSQLAVVFETGLPKGRYAVVGGDHQSANGQAWQLSFQNQRQRPGGLSISSIVQRAPEKQYNGGWGVWGYFDAYLPPLILILADGADAAHEGYLKCIPVPPGTGGGAYGPG